MEKSKIIVIVLASFLFVIIFTACKDKTSINLNTIRAGQTENLNITNIDTTIGFYEAMGNQNDQYFEIDVDNDGNNDLKFLGLQEYWHGPTSYTTSINCLHNNIYLMTDIITDTIFFSINTGYYHDGDTIISTTFYRYDCERISENDVIDTIVNNTNLQNLAYYEIIDKDELWNNGEFYMRKYDFPFIPYYVYSSNDTAYYERISRYFYCHNFPQDENIFIGFKILIDNTEKLGWIKIELSDNYKIRIIEYALTN
jgi:hypothetical protein